MTLQPKGPPLTQDNETLPLRPSHRSDIFWLCLRIGALSFGGAVVAWLNREMVQRRRWMSDNDFFKDLSAARMLPGTTAANIVAFLGYRLHGVRGAVIGLVGLLIGPLLITLLIAYGYDHLKGPIFDGALEGGAAAAIGPFAQLALRSVGNAGFAWYALVVMAGCAGAAIAGMTLVGTVVCGILVSFTLVSRFGGENA